ncbi:lipopolysaccharide biosynthesis protein [Cohaesibacter intestini]|uniref:lipopolysaccharide biosynthesis protein n=1 Tax=Cohaesibacter intestini TaxID=2211145 RepID=UPI000DEBE22A|nr:lipopolysaccharide biosynthesis protein [Cohaesibacter intestini]
MTDIAQASLSLRARLLQIIGNKVAQGIAGTLAMKVVSAVIAFGLFSLAANAAGAEEFGHFSVLFSVASMLSIVAAAGQELQIVRNWSEYRTSGQHGLALGALRYGWISSVFGVIIVSALLFLFFAFSDSWTERTGLEKWFLVVAVIAFMATNTLSLFSSHVARVVVGIKLGDAHYELTWRGLAIVFLAVCLLMGRMVDTAEILAVFAVGLTLVIGSQAYLSWRRVRAEIGTPTPEYDFAQWTPRSVRLWLASIMEASNQHLEVFLIGLLLDPMLAGAYFVASRLANAFALAASGINTFGTRRVPSLYFARDVEAVKHSLNLMAGMTLIIVVGGMGCVLLLGHYMLLLFGDIYMDYFHVLLILSIGTAITAANGPAPSFLMLTGHESPYMTTVTLSVVLRVIGFFLVIPHYGITGAAMVTAAVMVIMAIWLNIQCRSKTGMDPSIFRFLHESPDVQPETDQ